MVFQLVLKARKSDQERAGASHRIARLPKVGSSNENRTLKAVTDKAMVIENTRPLLLLDFFLSIDGARRLAENGVQLKSTYIAGNGFPLTLPCLWRHLPVEISTAYPPNLV